MRKATLQRLKSRLRTKNGQRSRCLTLESLERREVMSGLAEAAYAPAIGTPVNVAMASPARPAPGARHTHAASNAKATRFVFMAARQRSELSASRKPGWEVAPSPRPGSLYRKRPQGVAVRIVP